MNDYDGMDLINGNNKKNDNLTHLREEFKNNYAVEKGWDVKNLSDEQITEIKSQKGYQCPGMICG